MQSARFDTFMDLVRIVMQNNLLFVLKCNEHFIRTCHRNQDLITQYLIGSERCALYHGESEYTISSFLPPSAGDWTQIVH